MLRNTQGPVLDRCQGCSLTVKILTWHQRIPYPSGNKLHPVVAAPAQLPAHPLSLGSEHVPCCLLPPPLQVWRDQIQHLTSTVLPALARTHPQLLGLWQPDL